MRSLAERVQPAAGGAVFNNLALIFAVGVAVQLLWIAYAVTTAQWGFIGSALAYGAVNTLGWAAWFAVGKKR